MKKKLKKSNMRLGSHGRASFGVKSYSTNAQKKKIILK
jgi:hypothetical protein